MGIAIKRQTGAELQLFDCSPDVEIGDYVCSDALNRLDKADSSKLDKMPAIGYVISKPTETTAYITDYKIEGGFTDIVAKKNYFISDAVPGAIQDTRPTLGAKISQIVAQGLSETAICININPQDAILDKDSLN